MATPTSLKSFVLRLVNEDVAVGRKKRISFGCRDFHNREIIWNAV